MMEKFAEQMEQQMIKEYYEDLHLRQREQEAFKKRLKEAYETPKTPSQKVVEILSSPVFLKFFSGLNSQQQDQVMSIIRMGAYPPGFWETKAVLDWLTWKTVFRL